MKFKVGDWVTIPKTPTSWCSTANQNYPLDKEYPITAKITKIVSKDNVTGVEIDNGGYDFDDLTKVARFSSEEEINKAIGENKDLLLEEIWYCELTNESRDVLNYWRKNIIKYTNTNCTHQYIYPNGSGGGWQRGGGEISFLQFLTHVWNGKEYYESIRTDVPNPIYYGTASNMINNQLVINKDIDILQKKVNLEHLPEFLKKKSYIPIYIEPTIVKNLDELILIKKVKIIKTIKI